MQAVNQHNTLNKYPPICSQQARTGVVHAAQACPGKATPYSSTLNAEQRTEPRRGGMDAWPPRPNTSSSSCSSPCAAGLITLSGPLDRGMAGHAAA